jgi:hypothetical protein
MTKRERSIHARIVVGALFVLVAMVIWFLSTVPAVP